MKYNAHDLEEEIDEFNYGYARQASQPKWFDQSNPLHYSDTSGFSPSNEWAGFHSEKQALEWVNDHRDNNQGFIDSFECVGGKYYNVDDLDYSENEETCEVVATPKAEAEPATIGELVTKLLEH